MEIKRDKYLQDLINRMHNQMIKVVTGVRRSGKSYLIFHIFQNYLLKQGIPESHIWNEIKIKDKWYLMDVEQGRFKDLAQFPEFSDLYLYK